MLGVDVIPAMPPRGASSIQGDFLSGHVRDEVRRYLSDHERGRARKAGTKGIVDEVLAEEGIEAEKPRDEGRDGDDHGGEGRMVDVVLSDMSAPWHQTTGMWIKSVSNPYFRMMNTSGIAFRDHAGSMVSPPSDLMSLSPLSVLLLTAVVSSIPGLVPRGSHLWL